MGKLVILPKIRDPRFITVRRGGTLQDDDHRLLAMWAADCAEHVLHHFEQARPKDDRPRRAIDLGRAWARGEITWGEARTAAGHANAAARDLRGAARHAAYAAGQAAAVGHVAAHELGAAAYAIRAARAAAAEDEREEAGRSGVPVAARPTPPRDPGTRARRPAAAQRAVLVRVRLLTRLAPGGRHTVRSAPRDRALDAAADRRVEQVLDQCPLAVRQLDHRAHARSLPAPRVRLDVTDGAFVRE